MIVILDNMVDNAAVRYVFKTILEDFLGLSISFSNEKKETLKTTIYYGFPENCKGNFDLLIFCNKFWLKENYLKEHSLPKTPLKKYKEQDLLKIINEADIPVIYQAETSEKDVYIQIDSQSISTNIDFIASIFFMLSRYEEVVVKERDEHDRFPAEKSLAFQEKFLERPIVNEYVEIIWHLLKKRNQNLKRKERQFRLVITHDIDDIRVGSFIKRLKIIFAQILLQKSFKKFFKVFLINVKRIFTFPKNSFKFINNISKKYGFKSHIYFMANGRNEAHDPNSYNIQTANVKKIVRLLEENGHKIGLHASYSSHLNKKQLQKEKKILESVVVNNVESIRFHYLRLRLPESLCLVEELGFNNDSSIAYSEYNGFRTGSCYSFKPFDVFNNREMEVLEIPLIMMDFIYNKNYGKLTKKEIMINLLKLVNKVVFFQGNFVVLFHNESFEELYLPWRKIYRALIKFCYQLT